MPTIDRFKGCRFFFFSNEGTEPAHVHVEAGDSWVKFWLEPVELADSKGFNASRLREIRERVEEKRVTYLEKWHEHFRR